MEENDEIYNSYLPDQRTLIEDLENLDMVNISGTEVQIYDKNSKKISHREALRDIDALPCGSLIDLNNVGMLFQDQDDLVEGEILWIRGYPKAFLHHIRYIQADRALAVFRDVLTRINQHCYSDDTSML